MPIASDISSLRVLQRLRKPHPVVRAIRSELQNARTDPYSRITLHRGSLIICVAPASLGRALRFIDAFVKGAGMIGCAVEVALHGRDCSPLTRDGESIGFKLFEKSRQTRRSADQRKAAFGPVYAYTPTGDFEFRILGSHSSGQKRWNDTENRSIEDRIQQVMLRVHEILEEEKAYSRRQEKEMKRREKQRSDKKRAQERRAEELARRQELENYAEMWTRSQELATYITDMEQRAAGRKLTPAAAATFDEWVQHARAHVRRLETQVMPGVLEEAVGEPGEDV